MTKYIDAERYINNLRELRTGDKDTVYEYYDDGIDVAISEAAIFPAVDIPRWIPVTERMPEEDYETGNGVQFSADVLATIVNHKNDGELYVFLLKTVDGKWYDYVPNWEGEHEVPHWCEVIAWRPLPSPYRSGDEKC